MAFQTGTAVLSVVKGLDACCESARIGWLIVTKNALFFKEILSRLGKNL